MKTAYLPLALSVALCAWLAGASRADTAPAEQPRSFDARAVLEQADANFKKAVDLAAKDPGAAAAPAAQAAAAYRQVAVRTGIRNHALEINAGNASLLAGDLGHAVAAFRRAERLAPRDKSVQASLAAARAKVGLRIEPDARTRVIDAVLLWRGYIPRQAMAWTALLAYLGAWAAAAGRYWRGSPGAWLGVTMGLVALGAGALLAVDDHNRRSSHEAVITAPEVVGRGGPGEGLYEPSFKQPLRAGVECTVLESRGEWARVRLIDGRETWIPAGTLERV